jgi:hypothetical protein
MTRKYNNNNTKKLKKNVYKLSGGRGPVVDYIHPDNLSNLGFGPNAEYGKTYIESLLGVRATIGTLNTNKILGEFIGNITEIIEEKKKAMTEQMNNYDKISRELFLKKDESNTIYIEAFGTKKYKELISELKKCILNILRGKSEVVKFLNNCDKLYKEKCGFFAEHFNTNINDYIKNLGSLLNDIDTSNKNNIKKLKSAMSLYDSSIKDKIEMLHLNSDMENVYGAQYDPIHGIGQSEFWEPSE